MNKVTVVARKEVQDVLNAARRMKLTANDLYYESELIEEYGEYIHMSFWGYDPEDLREAAGFLEADITA